ncbi:MAG: hypothetical protein ABR956_01905 [Terracidiphilus sp.]
MAIDVKLTDREVVMLMTICDLLGKPVTMSAAEDACERSVESVNRETAQLVDDPDSGA